MNINKMIVCCVVCLNEDGKILLIKRGREPYKNTWALIGGVGYAKKDLTPAQGVFDEVTGDVLAEPTSVEYLFTLSNEDVEIQVFKANVDSGKVAAQAPYVLDIKWCTVNEIKELGELAFEHSIILKKFIDTE